MPLNSPFFLTFENGFNAFLWYCSDVTLECVKKIKGAAGKSGDFNGTCKQDLKCGNICGAVSSRNCNICPAAPGNVADHVTIERLSESTIMLADGARDAYLGYVTLKVGITSNGKDYSGTGPTKIVGGWGVRVGLEAESLFSVQRDHYMRLISLQSLTMGCVCGLTGRSCSCNGCGLITLPD